MNDTLHTRLATLEDVAALRTLVDASIRGLGAHDYDPEQIESSLQHLFGVDTLLIEDGTYYIVEDESTLVGAGGWSRRKTPFGGDQMEAVQDADFRDPATDPAVIRAFYVHPDWARRGIGRRLMEVCEAAARHEGFETFELVATLTGRPLYAAHGFREVESITIELPDGAVLDAVKMVKP